MRWCRDCIARLRRDRAEPTRKGRQGHMGQPRNRAPRARRPWSAPKGLPACLASVRLRPPAREAGPASRARRGEAAHRRRARRCRPHDNAARSLREASAPGDTRPAPNPRLAWLSTLAQQAAAQRQPAAEGLRRRLLVVPRSAGCRCARCCKRPAPRRRQCAPDHAARADRGRDRAGLDATASAPSSSPARRCCSIVNRRAERGRLDDLRRLDQPAGRASERR